VLKLELRTRRLAILAATISLVLLLPGSAQASGGGSIATAPMLGLGQVTAGGGLQQEFWRVALYSGDRITFLADLSGPVFKNYAFTLYPPTVTDYNLRSADAANELIATNGKNELFLTSPFSGLGTLDICEGSILATTPCGRAASDFVQNLEGQADPYSFTATIAHATTLAISAPTLARRGSRITVRATLNSPAGVPQGNCLISGKPYPVTGGQCTGRVRLGHAHRQTIHVEFVPDDGWQASVGHRTIRLVR
jgi:hypothetical protein